MSMYSQDMMQAPKKVTPSPSGIMSGLFSGQFSQGAPNNATPANPLESKEGEGLLPYAMRLASLAASARPMGPPGQPPMSGWRM